ncbi:hypothetical protein TNCV_2794611 [Trichonephila clavipes]|nr:hypothetical protein TNCV_2794611 [Trichonephila clavipes]
MGLGLNGLSSCGQIGFTFALPCGFTKATDSIPKLMASGTDVTMLSASDLWSQQLPDFGWCYLQVTWFARQVRLKWRYDKKTPFLTELLIG